VGAWGGEIPVAVGHRGVPDIDEGDLRRARLRELASKPARERSVVDRTIGGAVATRPGLRDADRFVMCEGEIDRVLHAPAHARLTVRVPLVGARISPV